MYLLNPSLLPLCPKATDRQRSTCAHHRRRQHQKLPSNSFSCLNDILSGRQANFIQPTSNYQVFRLFLIFHYHKNLCGTIFAHLLLLPQGTILEVELLNQVCFQNPLTCTAILPSRKVALIYLIFILIQFFTENSQGIYQTSLHIIGRAWSWLIMPPAPQTINT